jgi:hypothetical protein
MNLACSRGGRTAEMMVKAPFDMPEEPAPAMALPTMNMGEDWAAPQMREPTSKIKKKARKDHWTEYVCVRRLVSNVGWCGKWTLMEK